MTPDPDPGPGSLAALAAALRASASGLYCAEAGTELLIACQSWLWRPDFTTAFITTGRGLGDGTVMAVIDWDTAIGALNGGGLACSGGEGRMLRLAASIAGGIPVDLREALPGLDRANLALAATAVVHAGGHRDAGITLPSDRPPAMSKTRSRR